MQFNVDQDLWGELGFWDTQAPRFAQCILHIGTEKTGTTSLQNFIGVNRAALLKAGVFVPASLSPYEVAANHERLTTFALADGKITDDLRVAAQVRSAEEVPAHREAITEALREEIAALPADRPIEERTLLLSNEHCQSRLVEVAEVARLKTFLAEFVREVKVVVYLRPQHELAISLYDQALKSGYADISVLPDFSGKTQRWVNRGYFDYASLLERWAEVFGRQNLDVRIYGKSEMVNGSVIDDFVAKLGLDAEKLAFDRNTNISMSAERQTAMNAVNRLARARGQPLSPDLRSSLIDQFQQLSRGGGMRPTRQEAEAFYQTFVLSNERVRAEFLPEREFLFQPDFGVYPETVERPNEADAMAATIIAQQQTINTLKMRLMARR
jgi:hypothetical protein